MKESEAKSKEENLSVDYAQHAKQWEDSGKSQITYCQAEGLHYQRFVTSRSTLIHSRGQTKKQNSQFIPVLPPGAIPINSKPTVIILRLPKGSVIELPSTLPLAQLNSVFKLLGAQLC